MARVVIYRTDERTGDLHPEGWFDPHRTEQFRSDPDHSPAEVLHRSPGGRWILARERDGVEVHRFLDDDAAREWLERSGVNDAAVEKYFGESGPGWRPRVVEGSERVSLTLARSTIDQLDEIAEEVGVSRSEVVRRAILGMLTARRSARNN